MTRPHFTSEFLTVAYEVIDRERRDLRPKEIVELAFRHGLFTHNIAGKTPEQTMKAKLSVHVRREGGDSVFIRTRPGRFFLRHLLDGTSAPYDAPPHRPPPQADRVLVFSATALDQLGRFQGISTDPQKYANLLRGSEWSYIERLDAERRDDVKQVLTYVLVRAKDRLLAFKRGTYNRVEEFLRGSHCIGFGGHVTEADQNLFGVGASAARELSEELVLPATDRQALAHGKNLRLIGALNDDSSPVGRRHFAFVYEYTVTNVEEWVKPQRGEKSITQLQWISASDPKIPLVQFEYWSQLCFLTFFANTTRPKTEYRVRRARPLRLPHILCVAGPIGSGKSEATGLLRDDFGYEEVNSGQVLAALLGLPPVPQTSREVFQEAAWNFINTSRGPERLARALLQHAKRKQHDRLLIDGIRQPRTLAALRKLAGDVRVALLYVHTPAHIALEFYRERSDRSAAALQFFALREAHVERQVTELLPLADAVLYNWTGRPSYHETIHSMLTNVGVTLSSASKTT